MWERINQKRIIINRVISRYLKSKIRIKDNTKEKRFEENYLSKINI